MWIERQSVCLSLRWLGTGLFSFWNALAHPFANARTLLKFVGGAIAIVVFCLSLLDKRLSPFSEIRYERHGAYYRDRKTLETGFVLNLQNDGTALYTLYTLLDGSMHPSNYEAHLSQQEYAVLAHRFLSDGFLHYERAYGPISVHSGQALLSAVYEGKRKTVYVDHYNADGISKETGAAPLALGELVRQMEAVRSRTQWEKQP